MSGTELDDGWANATSASCRMSSRAPRPATARRRFLRTTGGNAQGERKEGDVGLLDWLRGGGGDAPRDSEDERIDARREEQGTATSEQVPTIDPTGPRDDFDAARTPGVG